MFLAQKPRSTSVRNTIVASDEPPDAFYKRLRSYSAFIANGQFGHDLALRIENGDTFACPPHIADAIAAALDQ